MNSFRTCLYTWLKFDPESETPHPGFVLFFILCVALALRLVSVATMGAIHLDGTIYAAMGDAFSRGEVREALKGIFPPVYPFLIGIAHLIIPDLETAGVLVSLVAGILLVYLSFVSFRSLMGDTKALYVAFFVAINPYLVGLSASVLSESTAALLVLITVITFYRGWTGDDLAYSALSGFSLSLAYLTRPEYVVYSVPLCALLVIKKKYLHAILFVLFFAILTGAYMYWMKTETGLLVFSKKAILAKTVGKHAAAYHSYLLPILSLETIIMHAPKIVYYLANALLPHFLALALLGALKVDKRYALLAALVIFFHLLPSAAMRASSKRFYIELIPLMLPFTVAGLSVFRLFMERFRPGRIIYCLCIAGIVGLSLAQAVNPPDTARMLNKQAGLYLGSRDPHRIVAARLPLVSFYSKGEWRPLLSLSQSAGACDALIGQMRAMGVDYAATDEDMEKLAPFITGCLKPLPPVAEFVRGDEFVKIYRIREK
jgi:hypothetical protein